MSNLRIAMVTASITDQGAGVSASVEGLSSGLETAGHDVQVFALEEIEGDSQANRWRGATARQFPTLGPRALGYAPKMLPALIDWEPDIVHLHGLWMHISRTVYSWAKSTGGRYVISPHGMLAPSALAFSPTKKRVARFLYQDLCFANAALFHATCQAEAVDIEKFGLDSPIDIIPHGIRPRKRPKVSREKRTVLSLGRLHPVKGLDVLIEAWIKLEKEHPDWSLRIVGSDDGNYREKLERLVSTHQLSRCTIESALHGNDKYRALAQADFFVLPSITENFGLTVLESLMMATPVIASRGTPWGLLPQEGCGDWVHLNSDTFAKAMKSMIEAGCVNRAEMGKRGRRLAVTEFSWDAVATKVAASYAKILAKKVD